MKVTNAVFLVLALTTSAGATVLDSLAPGTIGFEVHLELGEPLGGADAIQERYAARDKGIAEAECWYDSQGFVRFSRFRLVNELSPRTARLLFNITEGPKSKEGHAVAGNEVEEATTTSYVSAGVHFVAIDNVVKEIWRTKADWTTEELKKAAHYKYEPAKVVQTINTASGGSSDGQARPPTVPPNAGTLQQPDVVPVIPIRIKGPPRMLQITSTWFEISGDITQGQSIRAFAKIASANLAGETLVFSVHIRRPGGSNLRAVKGAPPTYVGEKGVFRNSFQDKALYAKSVWSKANALVPLKLVDDPAGSYGVYVLSIKAQCGGLQSVSETTCFVTGPGHMQFPPVQKFEIESPIVEIAQSPQFGTCYAVKFPLAVHGCRDGQISGYLELRRDNGNLVKAGDAWPAFAGKDGRLYSLKQEKVMYDLSRWKAYQLYFPQASLSGGTGSTQRYCARVITSCNGLQASFDIEYDFEVSAQ